MPKNKSGFTLLEILVVISIMMILASVILIQIQRFRSKPRDAEREQEMKSLQTALALYASSYDKYPIAASLTELTGSDSVSTELLDKKVISSIPKDPLNTDNNVYKYLSLDGSTYEMQYYLETTSIPGKSAGLNKATP